MKNPSARTTLISNLVLFAFLWLPRVYGQDSEPKEVETTLRRYFTAMSARDLEALRSVLDKRFVAIKATRQNAQSYVVDTANPQNIVPKNDDWNDIRVDEVKIELSATHPTVASATFKLVRPMDAQRVAGMETALKENAASFNEGERKLIARMIADRASLGSGFAMLARQDGRWKIVSLTFPKL